MQTIPPSVSMLQSSSRYETEAVAAVYLEAEWSDVLFGLPDVRSSETVDPRCQRATPSFYKRIAEIAVSAAREFSLSPDRILDVGSATGRTIYELVRSLGGVEEAIALEPSRLLHEWSYRLMIDQAATLTVPIVDAWNSPAKLVVEKTLIEKSERIQRIQLLNLTLEELPDSVAAFDLIVCCNLLDRHPSPSTLVKKLSGRLRPGGLLLLSSPLEFGIDATDEFTEIGSSVQAFLPEESWTILATYEELYDLRLYVRKWVRYVSQVVVAMRR